MPLIYGAQRPRVALTYLPHAADNGRYWLPYLRVISLTEGQIGRGEGGYTVEVTGKNQTEPRTAPHD